ncbi:hypothetical protein EGW08_007145, partial [Elysia chlorotica]
ARPEEVGSHEKTRVKLVQFVVDKDAKCLESFRGHMCLAVHFVVTERSTTRQKQKHDGDHFCQLLCSCKVTKSIASIHNSMGYLACHLLLTILFQNVSQICRIQVVHYI